MNQRHLKHHWNWRRRFEILATSSLVALALCPAPSAQAMVLGNPTITASQFEFNANSVAANIFDNLRNTSYLSLGQGAGTPLSTVDGTWLHFDFAAPVTIDSFVSIGPQANGGNIQSSRLIFSSDPTFDAGDPTVTFNPNGIATHGTVHRFAPQTAQYVRWEVESMVEGTTNLNAGSAQMWFLQTPAEMTALPNPAVIGAAPNFGGAGSVGRFGAANAADGDAGFSPSPTITNTEYASASLGADTFVDFDFGTATPISGFDFFDRGTATTSPVQNGDRAFGFDLLFSNDPTFATGVTTKSYSNPDGANWTTSDFFEPITARYVRYDVTLANAANSNNGLQEIIFYRPTAVAAPGDFDADGDVDGADFVVWQTNFPTATGATLATGDADGDGDVDGADFVVWQTNFPTTPGGSVSLIPEPTSLILGTIAGFALLILGRRQSKS